MQAASIPPAETPGPGQFPLQAPQGPRVLSLQTVGGPAFFFVFFFIVAAALHQETKLSASRWEMVPIYIGFQEINMLFRVSEICCACPSPASRAVHTRSYKVLAPALHSPRSLATAFPELCIWKLVKELMP